MAINRKKLIQIQKEIHNCRLDLEEIEKDHIHETRKPTHKPNKNMGEGTASKEELNYRTDLISPFQDPYNHIKKIAHGKGTDEQKKQDIQGVIKSFRVQFNYRNIILDNIYHINSLAINKANKELKSLEKKEKEHYTLTIREAADNKYNPDQALLLSPLLLQQNNNMENILDDLEYDIEQAWNDCALIKKTRPDYKCQFDDYLDEAFYRAENRSDGMGWYGWVHSNEAGLLATYILGAAVLGDLIADWVTQGDERVCDECLDLEANSPYNIFQWPEIPHFGCRCSMENIRLANP